LIHVFAKVKERLTHCSQFAVWTFRPLSGTLCAPVSNALAGTAVPLSSGCRVTIKWVFGRHDAKGITNSALSCSYWVKSYKTQNKVSGNLRFLKHQQYHHTNNNNNNNNIVIIISTITIVIITVDSLFKSSNSLHLSYFKLRHPRCVMNHRHTFLFQVGRTQLKINGKTG
jgi:hypothetical protein